MWGEFCDNLCQSQWSWEINQNMFAAQLSGGPEGKKKLEIASLPV